MLEKGAHFEEIRGINDEDKQQLLMKIEREARDNEIKYWGCSQAVVDALQRNLRLNGTDIFKAASALAGGVASNHEACGALTGGVIAIGLAYGRTKYEPGKVSAEQVDWLECMTRAGRFCDRFRERFGGLNCREVRASVGFDPDATLAQLTPERFKKHDRCGEATGTAARLAAEIILESMELYAAEIKAILDTMARLREQIAAEESDSAA